MGVFPAPKCKRALPHLSSQQGLLGMDDNNGKDKPLDQENYLWQCPKRCPIQQGNHKPGSHEASYTAWPKKFTRKNKR